MHVLKNEGEKFRARTPALLGLLLASEHQARALFSSTASFFTAELLLGRSELRAVLNEALSKLA